ncbi:MAG: hypothetical protein AAFN74_04075 [Myxococcota bacterium]
MLTALLLASTIGLSVPMQSRPLRRVDRAHVVGAPVLNDDARPGVYVWREDGRFQFAVVGTRSVVQFQVRVSQAVTEAEQDGLRWRQKQSKHWVARSRGGGRGSLRSRGGIKIGRAQVDGQRLPIFLGPLAYRAASTVEIGMFGALKRSLRR